MRRWCVPAVAVLVVVSLPLAGTAAPPTPTIKGDPQAVQELQAVFQRFLAARSWRARMTSGEGTTTTAYVAPDRFQVIVGQGAQRAEMFIIGRQFWLRGTEGCIRLPTALPFTNPREIIERGEPGTTITVSRGGPEAVEGIPTQTYLLVVESRGTTVREKMYVATATGLPRRVEMQTDQGRMTIDYTDFNGPITINDPPC